MKDNLRQIICFGLVGIINTLVGTIVMFTMYNLLGAGYWVSSATNYIVGSICSYILNKRYTFSAKRTNMAQIIRFVFNIAICYLVAYGIAKNVTWKILTKYNLPIKIVDNISMVVGMILFVMLNFMGQKFFVFEERKDR